MRLVFYKKLNKVLMLFLFGLICLPSFAQKYGFERNDSVEVIVGGLSYRNPWVGGLNSAQFSKIDLNNDSVDDLFVFDRTGDKILTFINTGTGTGYTYSPEYESQFPELHDWVLLRDYNCDGKKDIFSYVLGGIGVWKNVSVADTLKFENVLANSPVPYVVSNQYGNYVNLYVSRADVPDINDIDGDGDLDVLTFGIIGSRIEYHKNLSIENGYGCDSLHYEMKNECWGHFYEAGFGTNTAILFDTCTANIPNPQFPMVDPDQIAVKASGGPKHAGSTVLSLDLNNDNVRDLLLGDVSFKNLVALTNDNIGVNMNTSMVFQDTAFPSNTIPVNLQLFPAAFYEDIDNDNVKDLVVSPNTDNQTENEKSVLYYENFGSNSLPSFGYVKNNLLQDEMIEVGRSAFPVLFDYDNDGLLDLFVSNFGYFDTGVIGEYRSQVSLYRNIGTSIKPTFQLVTNNFGNLLSVGMGKGIYPTFADLDNDGDVDMICGGYDGFLHYFVNTSGSLSVMNMSLMIPQIPADNGLSIDVGYGAKPFLYDMDNDGDYDLVIGEENGNLNYYENIGSATSYLFQLRSETFGGINVSEWWTTVGNSVPYLFKNTFGVTQLFVGSQKGDLYHYNNIDNNLTGNFNELDTIVANLNIGPNSAPAVGDFTNDNYPDLILGNERGGVSLYVGNPNYTSSIEQVGGAENIFKLFPNPAEGILNLSNPFHKPVEYIIFDGVGKLIQKGEVLNSINLSQFEKGIYIIALRKDNLIESFKIIKE